MNSERLTEPASTAKHNADIVREAKKEIGLVPAELLDIQCWKGPRKLPKRGKKQVARLRQKHARRRNRGAYSGQ